MSRARTTSAGVHIPHDHLIRAERLRVDVAAYRRRPTTDEERGLATPAVAAESESDDATDWGALYPADERCSPYRAPSAGTTNSISRGR